jgi:hypothetical protein
MEPLSLFFALIFESAVEILAAQCAGTVKANDEVRAKKTNKNVERFHKPNPKKNISAKLVARQEAIDSASLYDNN